MKWVISQYSLDGRKTLKQLSKDHMVGQVLSLNKESHLPVEKLVTTGTVSFESTSIPHLRIQVEPLVQVLEEE